MLFIIAIKAVEKELMVVKLFCLLVTFPLRNVMDNLYCDIVISFMLKYIFFIISSLVE